MLGNAAGRQLGSSGRSWHGFFSYEKQRLRRWILHPPWRLCNRYRRSCIFWQCAKIRWRWIISNARWWKSVSDNFKRPCNFNSGFSWRKNYLERLWTKSGHCRRSCSHKSHFKIFSIYQGWAVRKKYYNFKQRNPLQCYCQKYARQYICIYKTTRHAGFYARPAKNGWF